MAPVFPFLAGLTLRSNLIDDASLCREEDVPGLPRAIG